MNKKKYLKLPIYCPRQVTYFYTLIPPRMPDDNRKSISKQHVSNSKNFETIIYDNENNINIVVLITTKMILKRNEEKILQLFFNHPTKHIKFKEITEQSNLHKDNVNNWLKQLIEKQLIKRIQPKKSFPYYIANNNHPNYQHRKRIYALTTLYESELLTELQQLKAQAIIIFGSYVKSDWHIHSDIDIFIYKGTQEFNTTTFERKLGKEIEIFTVKDEQELKKLNPHLLANVKKGYHVKGSLPS